MTRLAALHARITGDATGFVKAATAAGDAAAINAKKIGNNAVGGLGKAAGGLRNSLSKLSGSNAMRMLPMQFSQVAQQAAAGGGVMRALTIQAADIGLAFGAVGTVVGILATVAMPVLIGAFSDGKKSADELEEALSNINELRDSLSATMDILNMSTQELVETYGVFAESVRVAAAELLALQLIQVEAEARELAAALDDAASSFEMFGKTNSARNRQIRSELGLTVDAHRTLTDAINDLQGAEGLDAQQAAALALKEVLTDNGLTVEDLGDGFVDNLAELQKLVIAAAELENQINEARARTDELSTSAGTVQFGGRSRGAGGPMSESERRQAAGDFATDGDMDPDTPGGGGGKSAAQREQDKFEADLERLRDQLATEIEVEREMNEERNQMLREAKEQELLTQEEFDALIERERKRHNDAMVGLDVWRYGSQLDQMGTFMGQMASAFASGNEEMMQIAKVFGAGEALINAWRTYSQVMADPSLPWFAKIPAAISLFGSAVQAVSAIQGAGKGGSGRKSASGGASGDAGAIPEGDAASPMQQRNLTLIGDRFNRAQAIEIAEFMNEGTDDGLVIRGRR